MKTLKFSLVILLTASNLFFPSRSALSVQISQTRIPAEYVSKLQLFEEFVKGQMEKDKIPGLTIGFTKARVIEMRAALFGRSSPECGVEKLDSLTASVYKAAVLLTTFYDFGV